MRFHLPTPEALNIIQSQPNFFFDIHRQNTFNIFFYFWKWNLHNHSLSAPIINISNFSFLLFSKFTELFFPFSPPLIILFLLSIFYSFFRIMVRKRINEYQLFIIIYQYNMFNVFQKRIKKNKKNKKECKKNIFYYMYNVI